MLKDTRNQALGQLLGTLRERRLNSERRRATIGSFAIGSVRPRRRNVRRDGESHLGFLDWHESRLLYLAVAIVLLNCIDALFTLNLLMVGAREANLFMDKMLGHGIVYFLGVKIGLTSFGVVLLVAAANRKFMGWFRALRLLQLVFVGYIGLIAYELYLLDITIGLFGPGALGWRTIFG